MNSLACAVDPLDERARAFLEGARWVAAACEPLTADASARRYFRLRQGARTAILMDASRNLESVGPFIRIGRHLDRLGFSVPAILACDQDQGFLLLEDFGDDTFARLLEGGSEAEELYGLATDLLVALHKAAHAVPEGLRTNHP